MLNHDVPTTLPQLRANHKMHLTKVLSQSTKSCKAKNNMCGVKFFEIGSLTSSYGQSRISASRLALNLASFLVTMAQGLVAAADWRMACEK